MTMRAQAIAILGTTTTGNSHVVKPLPQPIISHVPAGSYGDTKNIAIGSVPGEGTAPGSGKTPPTTPALNCIIHMSRYRQGAPPAGKKSHDLQVGLVIEAMGNTIKLGPFFGTLNFGDNQKVFSVSFETGPAGLLNGKLTVTLQELTSNKYKIEGNFNGRLSGDTSIKPEDQIVLAKYEGA